MNYVTSGSDCSVARHHNRSLLEKKLGRGIAKVVHAKIDRRDWDMTVLKIVVERKNAQLVRDPQIFVPAPSVDTVRDLVVWSQNSRNLFFSSAGRHGCECCQSASLQKGTVRLVSVHQDLCQSFVPGAALTDKLLRQCISITQARLHMRLIQFDYLHIESQL